MVVHMSAPQCKLPANRLQTGAAGCTPRAGPGGTSDDFREKFGSNLLPNCRPHSFGGFVPVQLAPTNGLLGPDPSAFNGVATATANRAKMRQRVTSSWKADT